MKLPAWIPFLRRPAFAPPARTVPENEVHGGADTADRCHPALLGKALTSLIDQLHEVIDRNADGVNRAALGLRRETDLLLSLGISDPFAGKAGSYAQMALELANTGRGLSLRGAPHNLTPDDRAASVARAITLMLRAEMLMAAAKKNHFAHIEEALTRQERLMREMRGTLLRHQDRFGS